MSDEAKLREQRLEMIVTGYETEGADYTVPGSVRGARFAVVTEHQSHGYWVGCTDREHLNEYATANIHEGWVPVCYFDLDELAGEEPFIYDGDVVRYEDKAYMVDHVEEELIEGEVGRYLCLMLGGRDSTSWDDWDERVHEDDVEVVERANEDERMPTRYGLARLVQVAVFNTIPSP